MLLTLFPSCSQLLFDLATLFAIVGYHIGTISKDIILLPIIPTLLLTKLPHIVLILLLSVRISLRDNFFILQSQKCIISIVSSDLFFLSL